MMKVVQERILVSGPRHMYAVARNLFCLGMLALLSNCSSSSDSGLESELSVKLDVALGEIMSMQREIRELHQELNMLQARLSLPENILPVRSDTTEFSAPTYSFNLAGSPFRGSTLADIAIIEFTDYECPYCRQHFATTYKQIRDRYVDTGMVRYYVVDFPLASHAFAFQAAVAARCAGDQGAFWEYHDELFSIRDSLHGNSFAEVAESLDLDMPRFSHCISEPAHQAHVELLLNQAQQIGVSGTPTFLIGKIDDDGKFVEGVLLRGARPFSAFRDLIEILGV